MGYERNDRRYGYQGDRDTGSADRNRPYGGQSYQGRDDDRARSYGDYGTYGGSGQRDYRGDRLNDRGGSHRDDNDRGFFERAGDEVRSWFGDDEAERRRRQDERYDQQHHGRSYGGYDNDRSSGDHYGYNPGGVGSDRGSRQWQPDRGYGAGAGYSAGRSQGQGQSHHDAGYHSWRDRQMEAFDRDYDEYRRENQSRFDSEFATWRQTRQGQRDHLKNVREHQEVVGSDGEHIGTVDHVRGDRIQLTKSDQDAGGRHHSIPCSWIQSVDDKVTVSKTADQAKQHWRDEQREQGGIFGRDDDRGTNLNRSFSGTY